MTNLLTVLMGIVGITTLLVAMLDLIFNGVSLDSIQLSVVAYGLLILFKSDDNND